MTLKLIISIACICIGSQLWAQTAVLGTESMIEQLSAPRTRSLRNLTVKATTQENIADSATADTLSATATEPASLSLQIQFDFDSASVRPESQQALVNLAQALQSPTLAPLKFAVEGHTDASGKPEYNQKLSTSRAYAVRNFLKKLGVDEARIVPSGKGSSDPVNASDPLAAENRRVRVVNLN